LAFSCSSTRAAHSLGELSGQVDDLVSSNLPGIGGGDVGPTDTGHVAGSGLGQVIEQGQRGGMISVGALEGSDHVGKYRGAKRVLGNRFGVLDAGEQPASTGGRCR